MTIEYEATLHVAPCDHCGRSDALHLTLGGSAIGWAFALRAYPRLKINSWDDWKTQLLTGEWEIADDDGDMVMPERMIEIVERRSAPLGRQCPTGYQNWDDFHAKNHSYIGPNGLIFSTDAKESGPTWQLFE